MLEQLLKQTETVAKSNIGESPNYLARLMLARRLIDAHYYKNTVAWNMAASVKMNVSRDVVRDPEFPTLINNVAQVLDNMLNKVGEDSGLKGTDLYEVVYKIISSMEFYGG